MHANLVTWLDTLDDALLPALSHSAERLARLVRNDNANIPALASVMEKDPALALALLRRTHGLKERRLNTPVTTVAHGLMLLGLTRVRELASRQPVVDRCVTDTALRAQLFTLYARANHAAVQAYDWAQLRMDLEPDEVQLAAQLHGLGEMLLWLEAPQQMAEVEALAGRALEREPFERTVFGFALRELSAALASRWGLPELLHDSLLPEHTANPRVMGIGLAHQLARVVESGWYTAETTHVLEQIAAYLRLGFSETVARVHATAVAAAHAGTDIDAPHAAALLLQPACPEAQPEHMPAETPVPNPALYRRALQDLERPGMDLASILALTLEAMQQGVGLSRVVFASLSKDRHQLRARQVIGGENDAAFRRFEIGLSGNPLFAQLMAKPQAVWVSPTNRERFAPLLPADFRALAGTGEFCAVSVFVGEHPLGLFYADRHSTSSALDAEAYHQFKQLALAAARAMGNSLRQ